ncbi:MAG: porin family protein, partial [Ferruginibacter sp.]
MKNKLLFFVMALISITSSFAQTADRYTVSGGVLGAVNYSKFRLSDDIAGTDTKFKWGYAPGVFVAFPIGNAVSLEVQAQYSRVGSKYEAGSTNTLNQELTYLSVPLFFKIHAGKFLAFNLGGQGDFLLSAKDKTLPVEVDNEDAFEHNSFGVLGGVEIFPRGRVTLYGKYVHGLKQIDKTQLLQRDRYNQQIQAGAKFKLFGKSIPGIPPPPPVPVVVDRDGDGV